MRYTTIFTVLSLTFSGAMAAESVGPPFDFDFPKNPCEWVGGTCDPITLNYCTGARDVKLAGFPCGSGGIVGVGCCWHEGSPNHWFDEWKEWQEYYGKEWREWYDRRFD